MQCVCERERERERRGERGGDRYICQLVIVHSIPKIQNCKSDFDFAQPPARGGDSPVERPIETNGLS